MEIEEKLALARKLTAERSRNCPTCLFFLYEIDKDDERVFRSTAREDWILSEEFEAYNGQVVAEYFDGIEV